MFTGIIEATAEVHSFQDSTLVLTRPPFFDDIKIGSSIAVSGVCLSVIAFDARSMAFNVVLSTLSKTTIGTLHSGSLVNLERALSANGRFEGHVVQGHIEGVAVLREPAVRGTDLLLLNIPPDLRRFVVPQGSIALDGVALTVASIEDGVLTVALIPHTLEHTTLGRLKKGDRVNVETDLFARILLHAHESQ